MTSQKILQSIFLISAALVTFIYFEYRPDSWPGGLQSLECLLAFIILASSALFVLKMERISVLKAASSNFKLGLFIGLLWTIEIGINNFIRPGLPLRDIIDDIFWAIIALLILGLAFYESYKYRKIISGVLSGFLTGFSSGAVACISALLLIAFGMDFILKDQLNIKEWSDVRQKVDYPDMASYFAYQSLTGAILHLVVLGVIMGLLLGIIGGTLGFVFKKKINTN